MLVSCFITFLPTETDHIPHFILRPKSIRVVFLSFLLQHFFLSTVNFFSLRSRVELFDAVVYVMRGWLASRFSLRSLLRRFRLHFHLLRIPSWEERLFATWRFSLHYDERAMRRWELLSYQKNRTKIILIASVDRFPEVSSSEFMTLCVHEHSHHKMLAEQLQHWRPEIK